MIPTVPCLETERLTLRGHRLDDFADSAALSADPAVTRYIGGRPSSTEESWARLLRFAGHWTLLGFGYWVVREKATNLFVGEVGLADYRRDVQPPLGPAPEIGWVLATASHGRGYATEAVQAVLAWADCRGWSRTVCLIDPRNVPSLRVAEKCNYKRYAQGTYKGEEVWLFERDTSAG